MNGYGYAARNGELPWLGLYQPPFWERAHSPEFPDWLRLEFAAYARADGIHGHARFQSGELQDVLARADPETGELFPCRDSQVRRAIRTAKARGAIASLSTARCLVVPSHVYRSGPKGQAECEWH